MADRPTPPAPLIHLGTGDSWRPSRRSVLGATAWSVPVITLATAAPALAASTGTVAVVGSGGDRVARTGFVDLSLSPAPNADIAGGATATYSDPGAGTAGFQQVGGDAQNAIYRLSFGTSNPPPDTITVTVTVPGYGTTAPTTIGYTAGTLDTTFADPGLNAQGFAVAVQPDDKVLVAGDFTTVGGQTRERLARLNPDGSLDTTFATPGAFIARALALQTDGKVVVAGFTNGAVRRLGLFRTLADGTVDPSFANPVLNGVTYAVALASDNKVLVAGDFTTAGGQPRARLARFTSAGAVDTTFGDAALNAMARAMAVQPDGKVLVAGDFTSAGGATRRGLARFNADGTLDDDFADPALLLRSDAASASNCYAVRVQPDGKILAAGFFISAGGEARRRLARFNSDGTLDRAFDPGLDNLGAGLDLQPDGKILVTGAFVQPGGQTRRRLVRLQPDGTVDTGFGDAALNRGITYGVAVASNGKVLVTGDFTSAGGQPRAYLARFNG